MMGCGDGKAQTEAAAAAELLGAAVELLLLWSL